MQDTHARIVYKAGADLLASLPHMAAYLNLPDTKTLRGVVSESVISDTIQHWCVFRTDEANHVSKRPVSITRSALFKYIASSATSSLTSTNVGPSAVDDKGTSTATYVMTATTIITLIKDGPPGMFTRTAENSPFVLTQSD